VRIVLDTNVFIAALIARGACHESLEHCAVRVNMKCNYDFSKGVRGKCYRKGADLRLPIYLAANLQRQLESLAQKNGKDISELVNVRLEHDVELINEISNGATARKPGQ
jgi:predicted nucleic acid-binding protein